MEYKKNSDIHLNRCYDIHSLFQLNVKKYDHIESKRKTTFVCIARDRYFFTPFAYILLIIVLRFRVKYLKIKHLVYMVSL